MNEDKDGLKDELTGEDKEVALLLQVLRLYCAEAKEKAPSWDEIPEDIYQFLSGRPSDREIRVAIAAMLGYTVFGRRDQDT